MMPAKYLRIEWMLITSLAFFIFSAPAMGQKKKHPIGGGKRAVIVDERLSVLREGPDLSAKFVRRLGRGDDVLVTGMKRSNDGIIFYRVTVSRSTSGWLQSDAVVSTVRAGDDARLWQLIQASEGFDRLARAETFLELFAASPLRPQVLLTLGDTAEEAAARLSKDAQRRLDPKNIGDGGAPEFSYYLNYSGLDRFQRKNIGFVFDRTKKEFHYNGAAWNEILKKFPQSSEAAQARQRIDAMAKYTVMPTK